MIGAIMGDACDRLPVVMLINAVIRFFCFSFVGADCSQLSNRGWAIEAVGRGRSLFIAGAVPLSSIWHFRGIVLREVRMSQHEEQSFKIVAGFAVVGALVIAAVMALV